METLATQTPPPTPGVLFSASSAVEETPPVATFFSATDLAFELGLWLSGLESFLSKRHHLFIDKKPQGDAGRDWTREFRLTYSALLLCAKLNFRLRNALADDLSLAEDSIHIDDVDELSRVLRESIMLNESLIRAEQLKFEDWKAWSTSLSERLKSSPAFDKFVQNSERSGEEYLPENLRELLQSNLVPFADQADLLLILPRFGKILKWLSIIARMHQNDEPLKPTLLIFSDIFEQTQELIAFINNRLSRFSNEEAELFGALDAASYTASLELNKVYQNELSGLLSIRPSPTVYARIETAYVLLSDSFQQILTGFAGLLDPAIQTSDLFPNFQVKLDHSLLLRQHMWKVLNAVKAAESNPDKPLVDELKTELTRFLSETINFLFYKDTETIERFCEEIFAASDKKDLVPILHRFGAYLETLFGQVNMRTVLANHPFDELK